MPWVKMERIPRILEFKTHFGHSGIVGEKCADLGEERGKEEKEEEEGEG